MASTFKMSSKNAPIFHITNFKSKAKNKKKSKKNVTFKNHENKYNDKYFILSCTTISNQWPMLIKINKYAIFLQIIQVNI